MTFFEISLKLVLAVALGGIIGMERESSDKPAGFRTNILICIGSTMTIVLAIQMVEAISQPGSEIARLAAAVITGIGFIGAGTIIQARGSVIGLTTAATLWTVAVLGLLIGYGLYVISLIYTAIIFLTLVIFRNLEDRILKRHHLRCRIKTSQAKTVLSQMKKFSIHEGVKMHNLTLKNFKDQTEISFSLKGGEDKLNQFSQMILPLKEISEIQID